MIPCGVVFLFISAALRKPLKKFHKDVQEKDGQVRVYLQERISSQLIVRSFGVEDIAMEKADDVMELHKVSRMKKAWISNICNSGFSLAINGMYLLGIGYCGYGIINGSVSFGTLTAMIPACRTTTVTAFRPRRLCAKGLCHDCQCRAAYGSRTD